MMAKLRKSSLLFNPSSVMIAFLLPTIILVTLPGVVIDFFDDQFCQFCTVIGHHVRKRSAFESNISTYNGTFADYVSLAALNCNNTKYHCK